MKIKSVKTGFTFYFHGLLYPANVYCIRVNLKMPGNRKVLFSNYSQEAKS